VAFADGQQLGDLTDRGAPARAPNLNMNGKRAGRFPVSRSSLFLF
jgi:hypothetical protein